MENSINSPISIVGTYYLELVESGDRARIAAHLQEAACFPAPPVISDPFRLRFTADGPWLKVSARSRLFTAQSPSTEPDFIMSTHTVLSDEEMDLLEAEGARPPVGGPLMPSISNGESSACESRYRSPVSPGEAQFSMNDFEFYPWPTQDFLSDMSRDDSKERKDSSSVEGPSTPLTPRDPSSPGDGSVPNQPAEEPKRLRMLLSKKPLPSTETASSNTNNRILKDLLKQEDEEATGSEMSAPHTPHTPMTPHTPHTPGAALSPLHTAQAHSRPPPHPSQPHASHSVSAPHSLQQGHHNNSDVLLRVSCGYFWVFYSNYMVL